MKRKSFFAFNFESKEALSFWLGYFILALFFWSLLVVGIIIFMGIYSISYYNFNKFILIRKYLLNKKIEFNEGTSKIIVFQKGYRIGGPLANRQYNVSIEPKVMIINFIKTRKGTCFLPYKRELGLFKIYQRPFVITKDKNTYPDYFYLQNRICKNIKVDINNKVVINCNGLYQDIEKMEIIDNVELVEYLST